MTSSPSTPSKPPSAPPKKDMVWIPGGEFSMGSDLPNYPEEHPVTRVSVGGFWMDEHTVTVAQFRRFVKATGYLTVAERPLDPAYYPGAEPSLLVPGAMVFQMTKGAVDLRQVRNWWNYVAGASWKSPGGPGTNTGGLERHPVVQVCWEDVEAYAAWSGKALPTEAEWEFAARGGLDGALYCWGDEFAPGGKQQANTWQGEFPWQNLELDGYKLTAPVASFRPNGYGLHDMAGNVWEWTSDFYADRGGETTHQTHHCCVPSNPRVLSPGASFDTSDPGGAHIPRRVIKGGSHLCAPNYCLRYRPAARQPQMVETGMSHIGFRCIIRPPLRSPAERSGC